MPTHEGGRKRWHTGYARSVLSRIGSSTKVLNHLRFPLMGVIYLFMLYHSQISVQDGIATGLLTLMLGLMVSGLVILGVFI